MSKRNLLLVFIFLTMLSSCVDIDRTDDLQMGVNTSLPLGNYYLDDAELFELTAMGDALKVGEDGVLTVKDSTESVLVDESNGAIFRFEDQIIDHSFPAPAGEVELGNITQYFNLSLSGNERIDMIRFRSGTISMNDDPALEGIRCEIKELTGVDGHPVVLTPGSVVRLNAGMVMRPFHSEEMSNGLTFVYSGRYEGSGEEIRVGIAMRNVEFEEVSGFMGRKEIDSDNISLDINGDATEFFEQIDEMRLADPHIELHIANEFDIPAAIILRSLTANGEEIPLKEAFGADRFLIVKGENTIRLGNANTVSGSGITDIVNKDFKRVGVVIETVINPTKEDLMDDLYVPTSDNTVRYDSEILNKTIFVLPLYGCLKGFGLESEFDFNLDLNDTELNQVQLAITGLNGFPLDMEMQLICLEKDTQREVVLNDKPIFIDASNALKPGDPGFAPYRMDENDYRLITLDKEKSDAFVHAEKLFFKLKASTKNADLNQNVKIYTGSYFDLKLTIGVNGVVKL